MNKATRAIKLKGYSLKEFTKMWCISFSTYRAMEKIEHRDHDVLWEWIDVMEVKDECD